MRNVFENNEPDSRNMIYNDRVIGAGHINESGDLIVDVLYEQEIGEVHSQATDPFLKTTDSAIRNNQNN